MANPSKHLDQWKHNRAFSSEISGAYPDWIVTVAFYVALHAVDALLRTIWWSARSTRTTAGTAC